jgi:hypothetical protein
MAKPNVFFAQFFYRVHPDKTIDAICGFCFTASEPAANQAGLRVWEIAHRCSTWMKKTA